MRIFYNLAVTPEAKSILEEGVGEHELVPAEKPTDSVLAGGGPDPAWDQIDVALGQPDPQAILDETKLKFVQITSAGVTRYDQPEYWEALKERGIALCNSSSVYDKACAVHALSFLLAHERNLLQAVGCEAGNGSPEWNHTREGIGTLDGREVLIVGYGAIGRHLAKLLEPHGCHVVAHRRHPRGDEGIDVVDESGLADALAQADHVVNILPGSDATDGFYDADRLAQFKQGAVFTNIGRGTSVDQDALGDALESGQLAAAWLDVTDPEPLPSDHRLRGFDNCHITPHIAGGHRREICHLVRHFLENLRRFEAGEEMVDRIV